MIVKRFLFFNLEHKTPVVKVENGYKKQGRGVLGLVLLAVFAAMMLPTGLHAQSLPTISTENSRSFYFINVGKNDAANSYQSSFNVSPTSPKVSVKNSSSDEEVWYFVDAMVPLPQTIDSLHLDHYCYIVNAKSGEYLYYTGTNSASSQSNVFVMKDRNEAGAEADRFRFGIVKSRNSNLVDYINFIIYPRILGENNPTSLNKPGDIIWLRGNNSAAANLSINKGNDWPGQWNFINATDPTCIVPVITNTDGIVGITCATAGAHIYYTTDGTTPSISINNGTPYNNTFSLGYDISVIKAVAYKSTDDYPSLVATYDVPRCAAPEITSSNGSVTITCATSGATIYYTTNGNDPVIGTSSIYNGAITPASNAIVKAIAVKDGYCKSYISVHKLGVSLSGEGTPASPYLIGSDADFANFASYFASNPSDAGKVYRITADIDASGVGPIEIPFTGTLEGMAITSGEHKGEYPTISGLTHPLFNIVSNGTVRNLMLKNVSINQAGNVGAITCEAKGYSRIYNCGILPTTKEFSDGTHSTVAATGENGCAGGLVGKLEDDSRVVNCFSYADVSSSGYAAGIVGNNTFASTAEVVDGKYAKLRTMVVNCMFYGDITNGSDVWPVYGGQKITNAGPTAINNYNYYSDSCSFPAGNEPSATHLYNCSWPARYEYLTLYEFHRNLLNCNRELCGWWVGAESAPSTLTTAQVQAVSKDGTLMAKWVLDRETAPYPILKPFGYYASPINLDADASWRESASYWQGKKLGTLSVTVNPGTHHSASPVDTTIIITDMDTLHGDYCYRKIQLPYYNTVFGNPNATSWEAKYAHNYTDSVVTGWKITSVTGGIPGTFIGTSSTSYYTPDSINSRAWEFGFNFADRNCTNKDLYSKSGRVFAQGGYYYVPYDVTAITITAYWGKAYYIGNGDSDGYYDRIDFEHKATDASGSSWIQNHVGTAFAPAGTRNSSIGNGRTIRNGKISKIAQDSITNYATVYDKALVLVGNHQYCTGNEDVKVNNSFDTPYGFTIMSVDFDFDNEPDYCLEWQLGQKTNRKHICPIRFDFIPVVELGIAQKKDGSTQYYSLGNYRPIGHYEVTETTLIHFGQFEFGNKDRKVFAPLIFNSGIYDQYVKGTEANNNDQIDYIILGGHLKMKAFTPGSHVDRNYSTRHCAVNVIGGRYDSFYLAGNFSQNVTPQNDNPHCYIDGGWFGHVASAGKEGIKGDVIFRINHTRIREFYGGGTMSKDNMVVTGDIDVTVDNSVVYKYCGGPKFGDMKPGKKVTTSATGTIFGVYYGAGNGGSNYVQYEKSDGTVNPLTFNWNTTGKLNSYNPPTYIDSLTGYHADYEMEMINVSTGTMPGQAVIRTYLFSAQYAATKTGPVINTLDSCIVKGNFYGAGYMGGVNGNVNSTLTDTEIRGSAYGGGYSASIPEVIVYNKDKNKPVIDVYTGYITPQSGGTSTTYKWTNQTNFGDVTLTTEYPTITGQGVNHNENYIFTQVPLVNLGAVSDSVTLTINGKSTIGTLENGVVKHGTGNVFGGGDESAVGGSTLVKILDRTRVFGNIYGGGNRGKVTGDTKVIINGEVPETGNSATGGSGNNN